MGWIEELQRGDTVTVVSNDGIYCAGSGLGEKVEFGTVVSKNKARITVQVGATLMDFGVQSGIRWGHAREWSPTRLRRCDEKSAEAVKASIRKQEVVGIVRKIRDMKLSEFPLERLQKALAILEGRDD